MRNISETVRDRDIVIPYNGILTREYSRVSLRVTLSDLTKYLMTCYMFAYPGVRGNRSTLNTKTGYDDYSVVFLSQ